MLGLCHKRHFNHNYKNEEDCWRESFGAHHAHLVLPEKGDWRGRWGQEEGELVIPLKRGWRGRGGGGSIFPWPGLQLSG